MATAVCNALIAKVHFTDPSSSHHSTILRPTLGRSIRILPTSRLLLRQITPSIPVYYHPSLHYAGRSNHATQHPQSQACPVWSAILGYLGHVLRYACDCVLVCDESGRTYEEECGNSVAGWIWK